MEAIAAGNPSALRALYDRHAPAVFALCLRILRDRAEAEEVLGDVFYEAWDRSERFDPDRGSPVSYLMTLARSRALDRLRSRRRRDLEVPAETADGAPELVAAATVGPAPFDAAVAAEQRGHVRQALAALSAEQRRAVEMNFYDGFSHSEIAARLGEPLGTVKTRIRQGLARLRDSLHIHYGRELA
jgi:RNA polymerase sigma-70 factor (ECF subfamily)